LRFTAVHSDILSEPPQQPAGFPWETDKHVWNRRRIAMTDPRYTDPRYSDPRLSDPVLRREEGVGGPWGWIAGIAIIALIAFIVIAGWNGNSNTANNNTAPATTGSMSRGINPPTTTGSGSSSPQPLTPAPSRSAPQQ
jgi:hypothetical protein